MNNSEPEEPLHHIQVSVPAEHSLMKRKFIEIAPETTDSTLKASTNGENASSANLSSVNSIVVMQWNILAQALSSGDDNFVRCPPEALVWPTRKMQIIEEIRLVNPDIICLQEVDHYTFLESVLEGVGYCGTWMPKPDSPAIYALDSNGPDGCAMFFRKEKLHLLNQQKSVLQSNKVDCNQVCIMSKFQIKESGSVFNVGVTHLKAKRGWHELRLSQGLDFLLKLKDFARDEPIIVCGDFNASPSEAVIEAFKESDLNLKSVYELPHFCEGIQPYSTWKIRGYYGKETETCLLIDYIWVSGEKFSVQALLSIPTEDEIGPDRLPCFKYPSDHFSLAVQLKLF